MAKLIDYDVTGVEESGGGTGVKVTPGVKIARVARLAHRTEKRDGTPANDIEVALDFGAAYDWGFVYVGLSDAADWKLAEFVRAIGLKDKGKLNLEKIAGEKPFLRAKINPGVYNGEYSPDIGRLMPVQDGDEAIWEEGQGGGVSEISNAAVGDDTDPRGAEDEASGGKEYPAGYVPWREGGTDPNDADVTIGSYDDWPEEDLEGEVGDRGLVIAGGRGAKKTKLINALREDDAEAAGEGDAADEPAAAAPAEATGDTPSDEYGDWDLEQLQAEIKDRQLDEIPPVRGSGAAERLKAKIVAALREDDEANPFQS